MRLLALPFVKGLFLRFYISLTAFGTVFDLLLVFGELIAPCLDLRHPTRKSGLHRRGRIQQHLKLLGGDPHLERFIVLGDTEFNRRVSLLGRVGFIFSIDLQPHPAIAVHHDLWGGSLTRLRESGALRLRIGFIKFALRFVFIKWT
ncbi:hypothetical protein ARNL5_02988 [Anaerolineae bacterium]|nr:hypothetical protein ARNL5_02988 [Anaerolineae bacterium]